MNEHKANIKKETREINKLIKELKAEVERIASNNDYVADCTLSCITAEIDHLLKNVKKF